jgi:hypothetical protein
LGCSEKGVHNKQWFLTIKIKYSVMGIFGKLFSKKPSEQELYWKENPEELHEIEENGKTKLAALNEVSAKIESAVNIDSIISLKNICISILEWFAVLDAKECPYHMVNGADFSKKNLLIKYNSVIVSANKLSSEDFITARNSLSKDVQNYELCLSELSQQEANGIIFFGYPQRWINTVKRLFNENNSMDLSDIYVECGIPENIAFSKNIELISENMPVKKGTELYDVFFTYRRALCERFYLQNLPLNKIDVSEYNLNLSDEIIYHRINVVTLYEEKVVRQDIIYSGLRWSNGLLRAGTISAIGHEITHFVPQDIGRLFITNKRIIFVGAQKNITKAIKIKDILLYNLYQDGVLINQANKKAILFKFDQFVDYETYQIGDGLNEFVIVLNRILNGTEKENFENENNKKIIQLSQVQ